MRCLLPLFLLISSQTLFSFLPGAVAAELCETPNLPISTGVHYIVINDIAAGDLLSEAHGFLFQQMYCSLNEAKKTARVKLDAWHIDSDSNECVVFNSGDSFENIRGKSALEIIPPSHTPSNLCEKLEIARKCADVSKIMGDKVEIAVPLMNHESLGKCDLDKIFSFPDYKITVFWTNDYFEKNYSSIPKNFDVVAFGSGLDFLPSKDEWTSNDAMVFALRNGKTEMTKSLKERFEKMMISKRQTPLISSTTTTTTELPFTSTAVKVAAPSLLLQNSASKTPESTVISLEVSTNSSGPLETTKSSESFKTPESTSVAAMLTQVSANFSLLLENTSTILTTDSKRIMLAKRNMSALYMDSPSNETNDFKPLNKLKNTTTT